MAGSTALRSDAPPKVDVLRKPRLTAGFAYRRLNFYNQTMPVMTLFGFYLVWHYTSAFADLLILYRNFLSFIAHFFSFSTLLKTLISPWRRLGERYQGGWHLSAWLETLIINFFMRVIGLLFRLALLGVGIVVWLLALAGGLLFFIIWPFLPLAILGLIWFGFNLLT